jgi:hypothetical protein
MIQNSDAKWTYQWHVVDVGQLGTPRARYDERSSKFSLSYETKFNRPVGERNHFRR